MEKQIQRLGLLPADRIIVPKSEFGIIQHHAIYLGQNQYGQDIIAENKIGVGVRLITADDFFEDIHEITQIQRFYGNTSERN